MQNITLSKHLSKRMYDDRAYNHGEESNPCQRLRAHKAHVVYILYPAFTCNNTQITYVLYAVFYKYT